MSTILKSPRQEEFSVLMHTMEELGYRAADVARLLGLTHGAISQYLSGKTNPSETVLGLFRRIVEEKNVGKEPASGRDKNVKEQLEDLRRRAPDAYAAVKSTISQFHKNLPTVVSSKASAAAGRMLKKGAASVRKYGPK